MTFRTGRQRISVLGAGMVLAAGLVLAVALAGCGGGGGSQYAGTWESVEHYMGGQRMTELEGRTITLNADGTARTAMGAGKYEVRGGQILFTKDGNESPDITYTVDGDKLVVESPVAKIVYQKK